MDDDREPGTLRPGGRTARAARRRPATAGDALAQCGLGGLDLADIAARAGVGKTRSTAAGETPPDWWPTCWQTWPSSPFPAATPAPCSATCAPTPA